MNTAGPRLTVTPTCRVLVDNDWAGDPDGLVALAHHLLSPGNVVVGVTSSLISPMFGPPEGKAAAGAALAAELVALAGPARPPVAAGPDTPFDPDTSPAVDTSPAAELIIAEALRDDPLPLVVVCAGPLTNVATALAREPRIAQRFRLAWVGGTGGDAWEYNQQTDPSAAAYVRGVPGLERWEFPLETYAQVAVSVTELEVLLGGTGPLGAWLWRRFCELPLPEGMTIPSVWHLGDSCPVIGTGLATGSSSWRVDPHGGNRVCTVVDTRLLVADLAALLTKHAAAHTV